MDDDLDHALTGVGGRLRSLRQDRSLTLQAVADSTRISVSTLSRLESGARRPTLELLLPVARTYEVSLDDLVDAPATGDPRVHMRPVTRGGRTMIPLSRRSEGIQAIKMILPPEPDDGGGPGGPQQRTGRGAPAIQQQTHTGYEWMYVLEGRVRLVLGEHDLVLEPGEAAEFDTRVPHGFGAVGPDGAELLALFGTQGERAHLRAGPRRRA